MSFPSFAQKKILNVGLHDIAPLAYLDSDGQATGFIIEILDAIAEQENWDLAYKHGTWNQCLDWLLDKKIDLLFPVFYTAERAVNFSYCRESIFTTWGRVFADRNAVIESILDLQDKVVAVTRRDIFNTELKKLTESFSLNTEYIEKETSDDIFRSVSQGEADAGATEQIDGRLHADRYNLAPTPIVFFPGDAYFISHKELESDILTRIDQALKTLKSDPQSLYYQAYEKWIGKDKRIVFPDWAKVILLAAAILAAAFIFFSVVLRRQVKAKTKKITSQNEQLEIEIQQRREAEKIIKESLKEKETMLQEIHHRVKNNLQIISSLLRLQSNQTSNSLAKEQFDECQNRIQSMALIHQMLYQNEDLAQINMHTYLAKLVKSLKYTYAGRMKNIEVDIKGSAAPLDLNHAIPCGLIVNELVSNAVKHAFHKKKAGRIRIRLEHQPDGTYHLLVKDNGSGLPRNIDLDHIDTLGLQLVKALVAQLDGSIQIIRKNGTGFTIAFALL